MSVTRGWDLFLIPPFVFFGFSIRLKK